MSVAFADPVLDRPDAEVQAVRPGPARVRTRPRRPGPGVGPAARPRRPRFSAPAVVGAGARPRACRPEPVVVARSRTWHLTDRGLALVLVLASALIAASVVVVGLTALRVTGESYHPSHSVAAPVVVEP